jgi:hypothetical protein
MDGASSINGRAQKCLQNFIREKLKGRAYLGHLGMDGRTIAK